MGSTGRGMTARTEPSLLPSALLDCCTARNTELLPRPEARQYVRGAAHIIAPGCFVQEVFSHRVEGGCGALKPSRSAVRMPRGHNAAFPCPAMAQAANAAPFTDEYTKLTSSFPRAA